MEKYTHQREEENIFFEFLDRLPERLLKSIIKNEITTLMNVRRKRTRPQTPDELMSKLYNQLTQKMGEHKELIEVMYSPSEINATGVTPRLAGELADHAYYRLQDNIPDTESFDKWYSTQFNFGLMGIEKRSILIFCILKYSTRIEHGNETTTKDFEHGRLENYIKSHPELANLWGTKKPDPNPHLFNLIESMN